MVQLRPATAKDDAFIESLYRSTREDELKLTNWPEQQKKAFIIMQLMAQLADYKKNYPNAVQQLIIFKKQNAGRLYTAEDDAAIHILDIALLPVFRNKGIGTYLLQELIKRSNTYRKMISLQVYKDNPALHLYQRLGFVEKGTVGLRYYMEKKPGEAANKSQVTN
jgi:ribosomal protein S18 acetylase RimI-like enzyme